MKIKYKKIKHEKGIWHEKRTPEYLVEIKSYEEKTFWYARRVGELFLVYREKELTTYDELEYHVLRKTKKGNFRGVGHFINSTDCKIILNLKD